MSEKKEPRNDTVSLPVLFRSEGSVIGSAMVNYHDGEWTANILLSDSAARDLGLAVTMESTWDSRVGRHEFLVVKPKDEEY